MILFALYTMLVAFMFIRLKDMHDMHDITPWVYDPQMLCFSMGMLYILFAMAVTIMFR